VDKGKCILTHISAFLSPPNEQFQSYPNPQPPLIRESGESRESGAPILQSRPGQAPLILLSEEVVG